MPNADSQIQSMQYAEIDSVVELRRLNHDAVLNGYLSWMNDPYINQFLESRFKIWTEDELKSYIDQMNSSPVNHFFGIYSPEGKYIGNIKLGPIDAHHHRASVGIIIGDKDAQGKGYGLSAVHQIIKLGFDELNLQKITAGCYAPNVASQRLFEKAGFVIEAKLRDHAEYNGKRCDALLMGCTAQDYQSLKARGLP